MLARHGECNHCTWCCQFIVIERVTIAPSKLTPDEINFYQLRGGQLGADGHLRVVQHAFVPFSLHDRAAGRCTSYAPRPQVCSPFPTLPEQIEGTPCSYWFETPREDGPIGIG